MMAPKSVEIFRVRLSLHKIFCQKHIPRSRRRSASSITKCLIDRREKPFVFSRWSGGSQCMEKLNKQGLYTE